MPRQEVTRVSLRKEFVVLALQPGSNRRALCRRFGIAPKTGYKWLARHAQAGLSGLADRSKRPRRSPRAPRLKWRSACSGCGLDREGE